ncbi:MAG: hypothetical protein EHM48_01980 [Planctomycetaceae bacterium]|nr:MAG: hypothetical protein EHM48_01980 [Planctomycetaceae bacterium]
MAILVLTAIPGFAFAADAAAPVAADKAVTAPLADFSASGTLQQVIEQIAKQAKVKILVDWISLSDAGASPDAKVSVKAPNATAGQLLDAALAQAAGKGKPLTWIADAASVRVSTQEQILRRGKNVAGTLAGGPFTAKDSPAGQAGAEPKGQPPTSMPAAVAKEINFDDTPLSDALATIREMAGVNYHINWKALQLIGIDKNAPVSLQAKNISPAQAMDLIFDTLNTGKNKMESIYWVVDGGVVIVSTGTALDTETRTRTFDAAEMLLVVPNFTGPNLNLGTNNPNANTTVDNSTIAISDKDRSIQNLTEAIQNTIGKDMWAPTGKGSIKVIHNQLVVTQTLLGWKLMERAAK